MKGRPHWRAEATRRGASWVVVLRVFRELRAAQVSEREHLSEIRSRVWTAYNSSVWAGTSRQSMKLKYRRAFAEGDLCSIPRFDECADELMQSLPYVRDAGHLFELISRPVDELPPVDETFELAITFCVERDTGSDSLRTHEHCDPESAERVGPDW